MDWICGFLTGCIAGCIFGLVLAPCRKETTVVVTTSAPAGVAHCEWIGVAASSLARLMDGTSQITRWKQRAKLSTR